MAVNVRLKRLLEGSRVEYQIVPHPEEFTALEVAHSAHVTGRKLAKVVVVRDATGTDLMVVLPASHQLHAETLQHVSGRPGIRLEDEAELQRLFPDCELGAMPPFGHLYGMATYVDPCLKREGDLYFQAGNHHELVRMSFDRYAKLSGAFVCACCLNEQEVFAY